MQYPDKVPDHDRQLVRNLLKGVPEALREGMAKSRVEAGTRSATQLDKPTRIAAFGPFTERLDYEEGCVVDDQLGRGVGVVYWQVAGADGEKYRAGIGKTPQEWDGRVGGAEIENAGNSNDYLLVTEAVGNSPNTTFRYLTARDIEGMRVVKDEEMTLTLKGADQDLRQMPVRVETVAGFR